MARRALDDDARAVARRADRALVAGGALRGGRAPRSEPAGATHCAARGLVRAPQVVGAAGLAHGHMPGRERAREARSARRRAARCASARAARLLFAGPVARETWRARRAVFSSRDPVTARGAR